MTEPPWAAPPANSWPTSPQRRAPVGLAIASGLIAIAIALFEVLTAVASGPAEREFLEAIRAGYSPDAVFTLYDAIELLLVPFGIAAYVVSCLWLQFARANAVAINPHVEHKRSPVWVWLGWWVPIVSLWFPFQVVRDIETGSRPAGHTVGVGLGLWWTSWLVYLGGYRFSESVSTSTDPSLVGSLSTVEWIIAGAGVVGCVLWCRILYAVTTNQQTTLALAR